MSGIHIKFNDGDPIIYAEGHEYVRLDALGLTTRHERDELRKRLAVAEEQLTATTAELAAAEHLQEVTQAEYSRGITHATEQIRSLEAQWAEETDLRRRAESERDSARTQVHNLSARIEAVRLATGQSEFDSRTEASYVATLRAERDVAVSEAKALRDVLVAHGSCRSVPCGDCRDCEASRRAILSPRRAHP